MLARCSTIGTPPYLLSTTAVQLRRPPWPLQQLLTTVPTSHSPPHHLPSLFDAALASIETPSSILNTLPKTCGAARLCFLCSRQTLSGCLVPPQTACQA